LLTWRTAVLILLALGGLGAGASEPAMQDDDWTRTLLPLTDRGWEPLAESASAFVYLSVRDARRDGAIAAASLRKEYRQDHPWMGYFASRSIVSRVEVDCTRRTMRDIASTGYAGNNLSGESRSWTADRPTLWSPVETGTVADMAATRICDWTKQHTIMSNPRP
jgi:hypothetical protein